jgi:hypothetical protein
VFGDPARLPCTMKGAVGADPELQYLVDLTYFTDNPTGQTAAWQAANRLACSATAGVAAAPAYALLSSAGSDGGVVGFADTAGNRALVSTYTFQIVTTNVPGGIFWSYAKKTCLQARQVVAGAALQYAAPAACEARTTDVMWAQGADDKIVLASTITTGPRLCVTQASGAAVLEECTTARTNAQIYSYTGHTYVGTGNNCLWVGRNGTPTTGGADTVKASPCNANGYSDGWTWAPEPAVGAGSSGYGTGQFVNYRYFGSCFEITNENPNANVEGIGPCKHAPASTNTYNQVWSFTAGWPTAAPTTRTGQLSIRANGGAQRCLSLFTTTRTDGLGTWGPAYPALADCNPSDPKQQFTVVGDTGNYRTSYLIKDPNGSCLGAGPIYRPAPGFNYPTVITSACDGGPAQRWNAPGNVTPAELGGTTEVPRP